MLSVRGHFGRLNWTNISYRQCPWHCKNWFKLHLPGPALKLPFFILASIRSNVLISMDTHMTLVFYW